MFFTFNQNNSGGYFVEDDNAGICECVIIEADSLRAAAKMLKKIGPSVDGFDNSCSCCGKRWPLRSAGMKGDEQPLISRKPLINVVPSLLRRRCFTHYADGKAVETVFCK